MSKKPNRNIQNLMDFQITSIQRSHMIHDDLCARNFWDDDCFDDCGKLHIPQLRRKAISATHCGHNCRTLLLPKTDSNLQPVHPKRR